MATFTRLVEFLVDLEGCILKVYQDVAGFPTVGIGHWISPEDIKLGSIKGEDKQGVYTLDLKNVKKTGVTKKEAYEILDYDMNEYEEKIPKIVKVPLKECQLISLISFSFNVGIGGFKRSTLLRKLNEGDYNAPIIELPKWRKAGGKVIQGLVNRRAKEISMWKGEYV